MPEVKRNAFSESEQSEIINNEATKNKSETLNKKFEGLIIEHYLSKE